MTARQPEDAALTCDSILRGRLKLWQPAIGYRFSIDPLLLVDFVENGPVARLADLGAGVGIVGLGLLQRFLDAHATFVEIQPRLASLCSRNLVQNELSGRACVVQADLLAPSTKAQLPGGTFDLVASCPPYYPIGRGGINPDTEEAVARHELRLPLSELLCAAKRLLAFRGRLAVVYPTARLPEILFALHTHKLPVRRLRLVYPSPGKPAQRVLVEAQKGYRGVLLVEPPFFVRHADGGYTEQAQRALGERET